MSTQGQGRENCGQVWHDVVWHLCRVQTSKTRGHHAHHCDCGAWLVTDDTLDAYGVALAANEEFQAYAAEVDRRFNEAMS